METEIDNEVRVLIVDDDEEDIFIIKKLFARIQSPKFIAETTTSYFEARDLISLQTHDAYIIDYHLGVKSGLDLLKFAQPQKRKQPFILLTGAGDTNVEATSLRLAASDYLVKGSFNAETLSRTLRYALQRKIIEQQQIESLVELNRSKDEFISLASHQLRTPATGVKQYLGMVLEGFVGETDPAQRKILEKAYESNERQLRIVTDLLKVAQVDAGKVMLKKSDVRLNELISDVIHEQQETYSKRKQTIAYTPLKTDVSVFIDADSVRMVLENIIDNASKYSEEDTHVEVRAEVGPKDVHIMVVDQGVGIDPSRASRLFEKFSRIDNPLSTKVGGTGLGLYWAKKIISLHDGVITHSLNKVKGTTFTISLPKQTKM